MRWSSVIVTLLLAVSAGGCSSNNDGSTALPVGGGQTHGSAMRASATGSACNASNVAVLQSGSALSGLTSGDVWIAGTDSNQELSVEHDTNGSVVTYAPSGPQWTEVSLVALTDSDVWVAGTAFAQGAYVLHWNGTAWEKIANAAEIDPTTVAIDSVTARAPNDVWFAGNVLKGSTYYLILEHWDGSSIKLVAVGPHEGNDKAPDVLELSSSIVWILEDGHASGNLRAEAVEWNGSHFEYHILPLLAPSTYSTGAQLAATSPTNVWAIGNGSNVGQIWRYNGNWQPYQYTSSSDGTFNGVAALHSNDAVIVATAPSGAPLTLVYQNTTRWHPESNDIGTNFTQLGKISQVPGTTSFWILVNNGLNPQAELVTCP